MSHPSVFLVLAKIHDKAVLRTIRYCYKTPPDQSDSQVAYFRPQLLCGASEANYFLGCLKSEELDGAQYPYINNQLPDKLSFMETDGR